MKSGAEDPFADDDFDDEEPSDDDTAAQDTQEMETETTETTKSTSDLPYKYSRDGVQDDRSHGNIFLRDEAKQHVDEVVREMEDAFPDESVYKIDVLEALVLAGGKPERTVEDELREMGYGMV